MCNPELTGGTHMSQWTLFSNHGHVLLYLAGEPDARLRDVAEAVGITERAVQKIVRDLQDGGAISVTKRGRRNRYRINGRKPLRHELESHRSIGSLVKWMKKPAETSKPSAPAPPPSPKTVAPEVAPETPPVAHPLPPVAANPTPVAPGPKTSKPGRKDGEQAAGAKQNKRKKPGDDQQGTLF